MKLMKKVRPFAQSQGLGSGCGIGGSIKTLADPGGQPGHAPPPKPRKGGHRVFPPPKKKSQKTFFCFSKVILGPSQKIKIVGQIRGVFSFGGILGWAPVPSCPPPKTGGWIRQWVKNHFQLISVHATP